MSGGLASMGGTFIGVMIISLLQEGTLAMGFQKDWQYVITRNYRYPGGICGCAQP